MVNTISSWFLLRSCMHCFLFNWDGYYPSLSLSAALWFSSKPVVWHVAGDERSIWRDTAEKVEPVLQVLFLSPFSVFFISIPWFIIWVRIMMIWLSPCDPWEIHTEGITLIGLCSNVRRVQLKSDYVYCMSFVLFCNSILGNYTSIFYFLFFLWNMHF